jgi:hypothetical protein
MLRFQALAVLITSIIYVLSSQRNLCAQVFSNGDVFVAVGNASVQWRQPNGSLIRTLQAPMANVNTAGMAFDQAGNLYVTMFESQTISRFDNAGNFLGTFGSGYNSDPESIVIDSQGNVYVGQADGSHRILKFDSSGNLLAQFLVNTEDRGTDWIDLGSDLCTMYYTSEGKHVKVFDVCASQQLPDLNTSSLTGAIAYAHRLLANGDTLVADTSVIARLDDTGNTIQTYTVSGTNNFFALNLDPDGRSFWSGDLTSGNVYKFDIASGNVLLQFNATGGASNLMVGGIAVKGEITASSTPRTGQCVTRNARFWFTHAYSNDSSQTNCATLLRALQANLGGISLGFIRLPARYENVSNTKDVTNAVQEALGFYWLAKGRTGDRTSASSVCRARKDLAVELITATANVELLGTNPSDCTYSNGTTQANFPTNLLQQARQALRGADKVAAKNMTALLRKFNNSGRINSFVGELAECSPNTTKALKRIARDPTTQFDCLGPNTTCASAEEIIFATSTNVFSAAKFSRSANLNDVTAQAWWKISPPIAASGRTFRADTFGSSFDTVLTISTGACTVATSNGVSVVDTNALLPVVSSDNADNTMQSQVGFTTDGTSTYFIEVTSAAGVGRLQLHVRSP